MLLKHTHITDNAMVKSSIIDSFAALDEGQDYHGIREAANQTYPRRTGVTIELEPRYGAGTIDYVKINEALVLGLTRFRSTEETTESVVGKHRIKLNFQLQGGGRFVSACGRSTFETTAMTAGIMLHPAGLVKTESYSCGQTQVAATISCDADYLNDALGLAALSLPTRLRRFLDTGAADMFYLNFPITLDMVTATRALLASDYRGELKKINAEAKTLDLLCQFFRRLEEIEASDRRGPMLVGRERDIVEAARSHLEHSFVSPPTVLALAHELGTNETKLSDTFKQAFGATIFDYIQKLRMERARELLLSTELSITCVAYEVGYEYPGNFATAFKRHFGVTPRCVRRR